MCVHALCIVIFALLPQSFAVTPRAELHSALSEDANFNDDVARKMSLHINTNSRNQHSRGDRKKNKVILLCFFQFCQPQCLLFESGVCPHTATYIGEEKKKNNNLTHLFKNNKLSLKATMMMNSVSG